MLRWISSVPPAIDWAGTDTRISAITPSSGAVGSAQHAVGTGDQGVHPGRLAGDQAGRQLPDGALGTGRAPEGPRRLGPLGRPGADPLHRQEAGDLLPDHRICGGARGPGPVDNQIDPSGPLRVPLVGLEVGVGLPAGLFQGPAAASWHISGGAWRRSAARRPAWSGPPASLLRPLPPRTHGECERR